jgi:hypothetical protein
MVGDALFLIIQFTEKAMPGLVLFVRYISVPMTLRYRYSGSSTSFRKNTFNRLYHIQPDCFNSYIDLINFTQYMLWFKCEFGMEIPSGTFI